LHGIQTLLRSTQPSTPIPAFDQFIGPCGKLDDCPCTDHKYKILHTNYLLNVSLEAGSMPNPIAEIDDD
jgi:hypothetical protein